MAGVREYKRGSITVPLTSCLTGLDESVLQIKTKLVSCHTADSKPGKQEVNGRVILPTLVFLPGVINYTRSVTLQIVAPLTNDSRGISYDRNMFTVQGPML